MLILFYILHTPYLDFSSWTYIAREITTPPFHDGHTNSTRRSKQSNIHQAEIGGKQWPVAHSHHVAGYRRASTHVHATHLYTLTLRKTQHSSQNILPNHSLGPSFYSSSPSSLVLREKRRRRRKHKTIKTKTHCLCHRHYRANTLTMPSPPPLTTHLPS